MSRQKIVLTWNGSLPRGYRKDSAYPVALSTNQERLRFGLHALLRELLANGKKPSPVAVELAMIAVGTWIADTRLSRAQFSEDNWTREIDIAVPVRDPAMWASHSSLLSRILGTLSGDRWSVSFYSAGRKLRGYLAKMCADLPARSESPSVALFSGGLDSFAGSIDLLTREKVSPIFIGQTDGGNSSTVNELRKLLVEDFAKPIELFSWGMSCNSRDLGDQFRSGGELTMRARSFLFFSASALVASAFQSTRVVVPENGFISLNVPLDPWRLGALTTRTTHPFVIARFNELLDSVGLSMKLQNPFQGLTKGEMLEQCANQKLLWKGLATTVSCSKPKWVRRYRAQYGSSHCGTCWPCLIRRAAVKRAFPSKTDPTRYIRPDLAHLESEPGEAGHIARSIKYGLNMLRGSDQHLWLELLSIAPLRDVGNEVQKLVRCVRNGMVEVAEVAGFTVPTK
jgi:hypothetical protein